MAVHTIWDYITRPIAKTIDGPLSIAGHRGNLRVLVVNSRGDATEAVTAPHLTVAEIRRPLDHGSYWRR